MDVGTISCPITRQIFPMTKEKKIKEEESPDQQGWKPFELRELL
jgi:hypothetical protein